MYTWIIYDISNDKHRGIIAKNCKQMGLSRVQKSVFLGKAKPKDIDEFKNLAQPIVHKTTDKLFIVPMTEDEYQRMTRLGMEINTQRIRKEIHTLFF